MLQQKLDSVVFRFFLAQLNSPSHKDWVLTVLEDLEELEIYIEIGEIKDIKKERFKRMVKEKVTFAALQYILKNKADRISENAKG